MPETLERRVLAAFDATTPLFRKTSCAVAYAHGLPDYNGHYGIRELCDICSLSQLELCAGAHRVPSPDRLREVASTLPEARGLVVVDITDRAAVVSGLETEQPRYLPATRAQLPGARRASSARRASAWSSRHRMEGT